MTDEENEIEGGMSSLLSSTLGRGERLSSRSGSNSSIIILNDTQNQSSSTQVSEVSKEQPSNGSRMDEDQNEGDVEEVEEEQVDDDEQTATNPTERIRTVTMEDDLTGSSITSSTIPQSATDMTLPNILECQPSSRRFSESGSSSSTAFELAEQGYRSSSSSSRPIGGGGGARMVKRKPVNRANLLPRPKAHLRVAAQLSTEEVSPDLLTEADVHRRFKSVPFVVPSSSCTPTNTLSNNTPLNSPRVPRTPSSPFHVNRPTPNRFPEQVEKEDSPKDDDSTGSSEEDERDNTINDNDDIFSASSINNLVNQPSSEQNLNREEQVGVQDEMVRMNEIQKWKTFRGAGSASAHEFSRSSQKRRYQPDIDQTSFKRRAISPSTTSLSSSCIGSPVLSTILPHPQPHHLLQSTTATATSSSSSSSSSAVLNKASPSKILNPSSSSELIKACLIGNGLTLSHQRQDVKMNSGEELGSESNFEEEAEEEF
ncbi:expressed protein [Phakopsora pachyrhizi]|uniref:Expressed protein n=1 Tax=Phakopsora pachyrhizi TaxID=170000 RepID=A0AAV0AYR3_PHAPC|nr:expressed protein [Phakopsora pachyrhizi]